MGRLMLWAGFAACVFAAAAFGGCLPQGSESPVLPPPPVQADQLVLPEGWPMPDQPQDNVFTDGRWALGKLLFFDPRLSRDASISCATCHQPELAFAAPEAISPGVDGLLGTRNAPTLVGAAYAPYFMSEGGVPSLELQVFAPVESHVEMDDNLTHIAEELAADNAADYNALSLEHYGRPLDPFVIIRAIATFERSLISGNAPFDRWQRGELTDSEFGPEAEQGWVLFNDPELACISCHSPPHFTTHGFANNGLENPYIDAGRFLTTGNPADSGVFKIPTLRNIAQSAPYMHDGRFTTLDQVLDHYIAGGVGHPHQAAQLEGFELNSTERQALLTFLIALSDEEFLNDSRWE
ncbi:MAG: cytochrome c peroxidase [Flavobacteriales bacterium]|nr:cytochrome c peroxidase [Flavobacteriales bacterium]